jgi:hypothetical protein
VLTDGERIAILRRAGFRRSTIAAILGATVEQVQAIIEDPEGAPALPRRIGIPDVQTALDAGTLVVPGGGSGPVAHDYVSNGDANGIFYALGVEAGGGSFVNPAPADGTGPVFSSDNAALGSDAHAEKLTDRTVETRYHSIGNGNNWALWDFGGRRVALRDYTVKSRYDSSLTWPTGWQLQASNDNAEWDVLDIVSAPGFTAVDQWQHYSVDAHAADAYRWVRLIDYADSYFCIGEVELYGDLYS